MSSSQPHPSSGGRRMRVRRHAKVSTLPALEWQPRALLVGCEREERLYLRTRLSLHRVEVWETEAVEQAIDHCAQNEVHLVVIDADVLGEATLPLCRQLRRPHPCWAPPEVLVVGSPGQGRRWRLRGALAGAHWLLKPLHPRALQRQLSRPLRLEQLPAGLRPPSLFG
ncbi:response regulator [Caldimonas thermodepolymerans]|uniref:response regulator transcription factor n=1 Tax=Caldimonas thermodepolymerans TaxID=215580 RepID=UPI0011B056AA|nr:response regulator transcription factor [Caldimonas thermodepolymerans]QPC30174.1 response regulator [Caldimonas thermodepolymerans]UZG42929.1 response regulator transcription factor [Caldimonas thermodepolymerans]